MALILRYRIDPPDSVNNLVYQSLVKQVGQVGLNVQVPFDADDPEAGSVTLRGQFISIEGEHAPRDPTNTE
jgi:hypothetical protein